MAQYAREADQLTRQQAERSFAAYVNAESEFEARAGDIVREIRRAVRERLGVVLRRGVFTSQQTAFETLLHSSKTWTALSRHWPLEKQRRIRQMVYQELAADLSKGLYRNVPRG